MVSECFVCVERNGGEEKVVERAAGSEEKRVARKSDRR